MAMRRTLTVMVMMIVLVWAGEAHAALTMNLDRSQLDFRAVNPGDTVVLADQGVYHNIVTCASTNGKTWYLKAHMVRPFTCGMYTIPGENFQWMCVSTGQGNGIVYNRINIANPFTSTPGLVYTSDSTDNNGKEVKLQFRYILTIPKNQVAGSYDSVVRWTMLEIL